MVVELLVQYLRATKIHKECFKQNILFLRNNLKNKSILDIKAD